MPVKSEVVARTEAYYDSASADEFYKNIWGGEDIHIGIYQSSSEPISDASRRTVATMAEMVDGLVPSMRVLDLGAGYGGSGRYLADRFGCEVVCLNLSETQNALNTRLTAEQGLSGKVHVVYGNFKAVPEDDRSFDVLWSQDAILHSGERVRVLEEVRRVLKPGGQFIFTDPMQSDDCPAGVLQPILERIQLKTLGSLAFYRRELNKLEFAELAVRELTDHLRSHYARVGDELRSRYAEMVDLSGPDYVDNMLKGLQHWVEGADKGYLAWGIMHFRLPS